MELSNLLLTNTKNNPKPHFLGRFPAEQFVQNNPSRPLGGASLRIPLHETPQIAQNLLLNALSHERSILRPLERLLFSFCFW